LPGRHGIKLRYSDPMLLDDVLADFPELTMALAPASVPWVDSQISIATHSKHIHRPVRMVAEILSAASGQGRQRPASK